MSDTSPTPELPVELPKENRTKNTLTAPQLIRLADWCRKNQADCETEPYTKLAARAALDLPFTITASNMSSTIDACDIKRKKPDAPPTLEERLADLETWRLGDGAATHRTVTALLQDLRLMSERLARLERLEEERTAAAVEAATGHPELPHLPTPTFGGVGAGWDGDTSVVVAGGPLTGEGQ